MAQCLFLFSHVVVEGERRTPHEQVHLLTELLHVAVYLGRTVQREKESFVSFRPQVYITIVHTLAWGFRLVIRRLVSYNRAK